jgi:NTP pyrophosphatase (non-canonical NTP hydrolase)
MTECRFEQMWTQQEAFVKLLQEKRNFPKHPVDVSTKQGQQLLESIAFNTMKEMFEAIQLLKNSKHHRSTEISDFDIESFKEELSDVLHYFVEVAILAGISSNELFESYMKKGKLNEERINSGY